MAGTLVLYANKDAPSVSNAVSNDQFSGARPSIEMVVEDARPLEIVIITKDGAIDGLSTEAGWSRVLALGVLGATNPDSFNDSPVATANGFLFNLNTNTEAIAAALGTGKQISRVLEYSVEKDGVVITLFQLEVIVKNDVYSSSSPAPTPVNEYYTKNQADARYLRGNSADTDLLKRGQEAISNGAESVSVAFATAFASAPALVLVTLLSPNGDPVISYTVDSDSIDENGFDVVLGAAAPNANYKVNWLAIL